MDWIIKKASALSTEEQAALGITGIPQNWPIEKFPYTGVVPEGFEQISDEDLDLLIFNNQAAYDAWLQAKRPVIVNPPDAPRDADNVPITTAKIRDSQDRQQFRRIVTRSEWLYQPKSLDFYTSKYNSLYNRKHYGAGYYDSPDVGDCVMQFIDASITELTTGESESDVDFQTRLTANWIKTCLCWENPIAFDVQGALLYIESTPVGNAWLWCIAAPDVPEAYGGSIPFMGRGMNLKMMMPKHPHYFDAVSASTIQPDPVYHSGRVQIQVKHAVGEQIGIQFVVILYEEPPS